MRKGRADTNYSERKSRDTDRVVAKRETKRQSERR